MSSQHKRGIWAIILVVVIPVSWLAPTEAFGLLAHAVGFVTRLLGVS